MAEEVARDLQLVDFIHQLQDGRLSPREFVVDCLTNLRHVADEHGVDYEEADRMASVNYGEEREAPR